jgi:hypothetical protein
LKSRSFADGRFVWVASGQSPCYGGAFFPQAA